MTHHGAALRKLDVGEETILALKDDYRAATLSKADRLMLDYVKVLTETPHHVNRKHIDGLRKAGFSDRAILDICQVASYFAFVNRLADGLGVELEDYWQEHDLIRSRMDNATHPD